MKFWKRLKTLKNHIVKPKTSFLSVFLTSISTLNIHIDKQQCLDALLPWQYPMERCNDASFGLEHEVEISLVSSLSLWHNPSGFVTANAKQHSALGDMFFRKIIFHLFIFNFLNKKFSGVLNLKSKPCLILQNYQLSKRANYLITLPKMFVSSRFNQSQNLWNLKLN